MFYSQKEVKDMYSEIEYFFSYHNQEMHDEIFYDIKMRMNYGTDDENEIDDMPCINENEIKKEYSKILKKEIGISDVENVGVINFFNRKFDPFIKNCFES